MPNTIINNTIGEPFIELDIADSTNNYAMSQLKKGLSQHGAAYFAHLQTSGKGRHGKQWLSNKSENIMLTVVLNTSALAVSTQFILSMLIALAAHDLFAKHAGDETKIKWPNDIYWRDRKAAGILIENIIRARKWQWCIAGIGININQVNFSQSLMNPVSLKQITGKAFDIVALAKELCENIDTYFNSFNETYILEKYNEVLYKRNEKVILKRNEIFFDCLIKNVTGEGKLIIEQKGKEKEITEVEWLFT